MDRVWLLGRLLRNRRRYDVVLLVEVNRREGSRPSYECAHVIEVWALWLGRELRVDLRRDDELTWDPGDLAPMLPT